ncbi:hypothetical protein MB46_07495 [Arthrobacter alpinus]|uniref:hypothetical protein n=1 Tax=Arthrobacter alpinus TaxID=656366 RepID=UPI0005CA748E|nr:hypothetical protein [Arthrobacter alpinus]ALV45360.1 hypothetical protein MB46_07495 [Arthrobacter alpinus]
MRAWFAFIGGALVALLSVWSLAHVLPEGHEFIPTTLYAVIIFGGSFGSMLVRKHNEKKKRSASPDSLEHSIAIRARAGSFTDALILAAAFGLYLVITEQFATGLIVYGLMFLGVILFWVRYTVLRSQVS